jgi:hypothetical protein
MVLEKFEIYMFDLKDELFFNKTIDKKRQEKTFFRIHTLGKD